MKINFEKPELSNIISLSKKRIQRGECRHVYMTINEGSSKVTCNQCKEQLDPLWVLTRFATEEQNMRRKLVCESKRFDNISKKLSEKRRTKCHHCSKMTPVNIKMSELEWRGFK